MFDAVVMGVLITALHISSALPREGHDPSQSPATPSTNTFLLVRLVSVDSQHLDTQSSIFMVPSVTIPGLFYVLARVLNKIGSDVWFGSPQTELKRRKHLSNKRKKNIGPRVKENGL
jgi:hypothetical protein